MLSLNVASKADTVSTAAKPSHITKPSQSHIKHTGFGPKFGLGIGLGFTQPGHRVKITEKSTIINTSKQQHTELKQKNILSNLYATVACQILNQISGDIQAGILINGYAAFGGAISPSISDDTAIASIHEAYRLETSNPFGAQVSFIIQFNPMLGFFCGLDWSTFTVKTDFQSAKIDLDKLDKDSTVRNILKKEFPNSSQELCDQFIETMTINKHDDQDPERVCPLSFICGVLLKFKVGIGTFAIRGGIKVNDDIKVNYSSKFKITIKEAKAHMPDIAIANTSKSFQDVSTKISKESCKGSYILPSGVKPILDISYIAELN
jgi:hypothetical protein